MVGGITRDASTNHRRIRQLRAHLKAMLADMRSARRRRVPCCVSGYHVTRWRADPYAQGLWSHVNVGQSPEAYDILARPAPPKKMPHAADEHHAVANGEIHEHEESTAG